MQILNRRKKNASMIVNYSICNQWSIKLRHTDFQASVHVIAKSQKVTAKKSGTSLKFIIPKKFNNLAYANPRILELN